MKKIYEIVKQLENTGSTNDKINILKENKDNELLKKVLLYTYDGNKKFGISNKVLEKIIGNKFIGESSYKDLFVFLDILAENNINDNLRREINLYYNSLESEEKELLKRILLKDLQCGISKKSINKAIDNLIEDFAVMKADKYFDKEEQFNKKAKKDGYITMVKEEGIRGEIFKRSGKVIIKSRQNKIIEGLIEIEKAFETMPDGLFEGEFLPVGQFDNSMDEFKAIDKIINSKGIKTGAYIKLFDSISLESFEKGIDKTHAIDRKNNLKELVNKANNEFIKYCEPIYIGNDTDIIMDTLKEVTSKGKEGLMVCLCNNIYESKKVSTILKVKKIYDADLMVIDVKEGDKPTTKGKLASAIVDYKGYNVGIGSGWTKEEREYYFDHKDELIGRVIQVRYTEVCEDKHGNKSLQHGRKIAIREEGKEISYN